jgi:hypothetical protein
MKKIKSLICILLTLGIALFICNKPDVVLANNHTLCTVTNFGFIDHHARVNVDFTGYEDTTILRVDVKIERQNFLFFNETVVSASYDSQGKTYQNEFFYPIYADGVYDCTVTYTVMNGGEEDLITFFDTQTYINSNYTERTHVWNRERTESTYQLEGLERKFCYCGKSEVSVLEKIPSASESNNQNVYSDSTIGAIILDHMQNNPSQSNTTSYIQTNFKTQCNCPFCKLDRAMPDPQPTLPQRPSVPTVDPWKKQQEAYAKKNSFVNPCHFGNSYLY